MRTVRTETKDTHSFLNAMFYVPFAMYHVLNAIHYVLSAVYYVPNAMHFAISP